MITHRLSQIQLHFTLENRHSTTSEAIRELSTLPQDRSSLSTTGFQSLPVASLPMERLLRQAGWILTTLHLPYYSATHLAPDSNSQIPQWWQNAFPSLVHHQKNSIKFTVCRFYPVNVGILNCNLSHWNMPCTFDCSLSIFPDGMNLSMRYYVI